jgi:hypothetical protein
MGKRKPQQESAAAKAPQTAAKGPVTPLAPQESLTGKNLFGLLDGVEQTPAAKEFVAYLRQQAESGPNHCVSDPLDEKLRRQVAREMNTDLRRLGGRDRNDIDAQEAFLAIGRNVKLALLLTQAESIALFGADAVNLLRRRSCREAIMLLDLLRGDLTGRGLDLDIFVRALTVLEHSPEDTQHQVVVLRCVQLLETLSMVTPPGPKKGISVHAASMIWCSTKENKQEEATKLRDRWFKTRAYERWMKDHTIGYSGKWSDRRLHKPTELLDLLERLERDVLPFDRDELLDLFRDAVEEAKRP